MATDKLVDFDHVTDYISREAAIEAIWKPEVRPNDLIFDALRRACEEETKHIPAADVVEVVHGKWEGETDFVYADLSQRVICDKCGAFAYFYDKMPMNFCPNCGADMREAKTDG